MTNTGIRPLIRIAFVGACFAALSPSYAAVTEQAGQRQEGRDVKQDTRKEAHKAKVDCRQANNKNNAQCRQDKRETKQDGREKARDIKY